FGIGPFPALGIAGGGVALVLFYAAGTAVLACYILSGPNITRLRPTRPRWPLFREILGVGAVAAVTSAAGPAAVATSAVASAMTTLVCTEVTRACARRHRHWCRPAPPTARRGRRRAEPADIPAAPRCHTRRRRPGPRRGQTAPGPAR